MSRWYDPIMTGLLRSPLHGPVSNSIVLITVTGRKSGRPITTPINYVREGDTLTTISFRERTGWRNLRGGAPIVVRLNGRDMKGSGTVVEKPEAVTELLAHYLRQVPQYAKYMQVTLNSDGQTNRDDVRRAAESRVVVQVHLS